MKKHYFLLLMLLGLMGSAGAQTQTFTATGGNQTFNVTVPGTATISTRGADGFTSFNKGGSGANISATLQLLAGDQLLLVVGQAGKGSSAGGGGGGGTGIILKRNGQSTLFVVASGGGGGGFDSDLIRGSGKGGLASDGTAQGGDSPAGGGGGGFNSDGVGIRGGKAGTLSAGGAGGTSDETAAGISGMGGFGFGGGGASYRLQIPLAGGGGGGGYGGGIGGFDYAGGVGGTSFVGAAGTNVSRTSGIDGGGNGSSGSVVINFVANKPILSQPAVTNVTCNGGSTGRISATATNGTPPYTFSLSPAAGTQSSPGNFTGLAAGTYTLTVSDFYAQTDTKEMIIVGQPTAVTFTTTTANVKCFGNSDGSITVTPSGGTPPYRYSKDGGTNYVSNQVSRTSASSGVGPQGFTFTDLQAGTYAIRVKDANNCETEIKQVTVTEPTAVSVTTGPDKSVIRGFGGPNSTCTELSASASGGTPGTNPAYTFVWMPGGQTGPTVTVCPLETTTYTVTATDANGCTATATQTVNVQDVRCGPKMDMVSICYYGVTQCVSEKIATRYLKLGATLGACGSSNNNKRIGAEEQANAPLQLTLKAFPNPVQDVMTLEVLAPRAGEATFEVVDLTGRSRQSRRENLTEGLNEIEFRLGSLPTGLYLIRAVDAAGRQGVTKVSKQ